MRTTLRAKSTESGTLVFAGTETGSIMATTYGRVCRIDSKDISYARFAMSGEFDLYNKPRLAEALEPAVACPRMTLDFARTLLIDASILGLLAGIARRRLQSGTAQVHIVNVQDRVRRLFDICKMSGVVEMDSEFALVGPIGV